MGKDKQKKIRVAKVNSLPEVLLADDGKERIREIPKEAVMSEDGIKAGAAGDTKDGIKAGAAGDTKDGSKAGAAGDVKAAERFEKKTEAKSGIKADTKSEIKSETKPGHSAVKTETTGYPSLEFEEPSSGKRALRIAALIGALVGTLALAVAVGVGLALWDMDKNPRDLMAVLFNKEVQADTGLVFADAGDDLTSFDAEDGLTFFDAEDETAQGETAQDDAAKNGTSDAQDADADGNSGGGAAFDEIAGNENAEDGTSDAPDAGADEDSDEAEVRVGDIVDGNMVVSAELSGIKSIKRAGQDEAMAVTTLDMANATNPDDVYPLDFTAVDESYFEDALFIGDSRFYGFCMWSGIPGTNYCATSFNIFNYETFKVVQTGNGKVPIFNALPYNAFSKIYIKVGLNEMSASEESFENKYAELIARLREMEPRAIIYIHAVLPVTAAKSASDATHNNPNIIARNASLQEFAKQQKAYYIDASPVLTDSNGCLKAEMTSDGIHMASRYMGVWKQYLMEHAVVVPQ